MIPFNLNLSLEIDLLWERIEELENLAASQAWKALERATAKALGGKRNPAAGGTGGADVSDVPGWILECKYRASFLHDTLFRQERSKRRKDLAEGQQFALVTRARGREALVVLTLADFARLTGANVNEQSNPAGAPAEEN